jgi:hypothetical protein
MSLINTFLILAILIVILNHLANGIIVEWLNKYVEAGKDLFTNTIEKFQGLTLVNKKGVEFTHPVLPWANQKDWPYLLDPSNSPDLSLKLYQFVHNITLNPAINMYGMIAGSGSKIQATRELTQWIQDQLTKILNTHGFTFSNINILDKIYYNNTSSGKEIELFNSSSDVSYKGSSFGRLVFNFEIIIGINNQLIIHSMKLLGTEAFVKSQEQSQKQSQNQCQNQCQEQSQEQSHKQKQIPPSPGFDFTIDLSDLGDLGELNVNDNEIMGSNPTSNIFIQPPDQQTQNYPQTENSLIPSVIEMD